VEISLYGASAETYEAVTGNARAFSKCLRGVERLVARGIHVKLKTMLMAPTVHEFERMEKLAESYSVAFRYDPMMARLWRGPKSFGTAAVSREDCAEGCGYGGKAQGLVQVT